MRRHLCLLLICFCGIAIAQQQQQQQLPDLHPLVAIQNEDYTKARQHFQTKLLRSGPAPQKWNPLTVPPGASEVEYPSGSLKLKAWINPPEDPKTKHAAVLFLHGGHAFELGDWQMSQPYRDAGLVVMSPILRGENGQPGNFTLFYDEVDDVIAAAEYLRRLPYVDADRIFVAGHSNGGTMTMLAALAYKHFRAAASLSGSPDQVLFVKYAPGVQRQVPFDPTNARELEMRSPLAFAAYFKCPLRIYYGTKEFQFEFTSQRTAEIAREHGVDVQVVKNDGGHMSHVLASINDSIQFFHQVAAWDIPKNVAPASGSSNSVADRPSGSTRDTSSGDNPEVKPPVSLTDLRIVRRAGQILDSPDKWNRADTRICPADAKTFSIYCALEKATMELSGQFEHRGAAMQEARFVIEAIAPNASKYEHRLMDYNNDPSTTFVDVGEFFQLLQDRIRQQLNHN